VSSIRGVEYELGTWSDAVQHARKKAVQDLRQLETTPRQDLVNGAVDCHLRLSNANNKNRKKYVIYDRGSRVQFPLGAGNFSLHHGIWNGSEAHPASCLWVLGTLFLGVKWPGHGADHLPPSSSEVKECMEQYLHSPNTSSWHDAQLKHRDNFIFTSFVFHVISLLCV